MEHEGSLLQMSFMCEHGRKAEKVREGLQGVEHRLGVERLCSCLRWRVYAAFVAVVYEYTNNGARRASLAGTFLREIGCAR